jgi:hypothetical protein
MLAHCGNNEIQGHTVNLSPKGCPLTRTRTSQYYWPPPALHIGAILNLELAELRPAATRILQGLPDSVTRHSCRSTMHRNLMQ